MNTYEVLTPIRPTRMFCLCCDGTQSHLDLDTVLYNGFGGYYVTKNGETFYSGHDLDWEEYKKLSDIEAEAKLDPDQDWQVILFSPLRGATYQRQGEKWVLVEENEGFA